MTMFIWRSLLRGLNKDFYHQQVTTKQIENYIIEKGNLKINGFFDQYLRTIKIPVLEYQIKNNQVSYKFTNTVDNFSMPVKVWVNGKLIWLEISNKQKTINS